MSPTLFRIPLGAVGEISLDAWFFFLLAAGILAVELAVREARRSGEDPRGALWLGAVVLLAGVVGARGLHVLVDAAGAYRTDPWRALRFWEGGMVLYGGIAAGLCGLFVAARRLRWSPRRAADIAAVPLAAGIAVGRLGCFSAGCCFGRPIDWPFGIEWPFAVVFLDGAVPEPFRGVALHPVQLYASAGAGGLAVALAALRRRQRWDGQVAGWFGLGYGALRSVEELVRGDAERGFVAAAWMGDRVATSQALSALCLAVGLSVLLRSRDAARQEGTLGLDAASSRRARRRRLGGASPG